jgi:hypothetical protein
VFQALTFESQLHKLQPEDTIVAPTGSSKRITAALSPAATDNKTLQEALDVSLMNNFEGIDWGSLRKYMKLPLLQKLCKSWVYCYGHHVALLKDLSKLYFVCHHSYKH